jgi:GDPmannose 4,6-dehydratase
MLKNKNKTALITGITGQDGSYLAELLIEKNYVVHGIIRRSSVFTTNRIEHLRNSPNLILHHGDITDSSNINYIIQSIQPDEIYHLAAQSHVGVSFEVPLYTANVTGLGTMVLLSALRSLKKDFRLYNASTSELFGGNPGSAPQDEKTAFSPKSPYAIAKHYSHGTVINHRDSFNFFCVNGVLFNHESPRRGETFVTRKITRGVSKILHGTQDVLKLGNLNAIRDWGYAKEYVQAMWLMLQQSEPEDLVIATNESHSVREFVTSSFNRAGVDIAWDGHGLNEKGSDIKTGKLLVEIDERLFRPTEVEELRGNYSKAQKILGWEPKITFSELISIMVDHDLGMSK